MAGWGVELRKGPGFGVSAVITVTFHDIEKIALTPTKTSAVDGAVSLNHKEAQCSEVPVEPIPPMPDDVQ